MRPATRCSTDDAALSDCACFIVDQKLSGLSGLEVIAALRRRRIAAPAILITSHPTIMLQERAARAGVAIVEKPLLGNALLDLKCATPLRERRRGALEHVPFLRNRDVL